MNGLHPLVNQQIIRELTAARRREADRYRLAAHITRSGSPTRPRSRFASLFVR